MATIWKTVSIRISEEEQNALNLYCEREKTNPNKLLKDFVLKEIGPILNKNQVTVKDEFPSMGENRLEYDPEGDNYLWMIKVGSKESFTISKKLNPFFVENLYTALKDGVDMRKKILNKIKKNKVYVPKAITKYGEKIKC
jgi:hypothetical protein